MRQTEREGVWEGERERHLKRDREGEKERAGETVEQRERRRDGERGTRL